MVHGRWFMHVMAIRWFMHVMAIRCYVGFTGPIQSRLAYGPCGAWEHGRWVRTPTPGGGRRNGSTRGSLMLQAPAKATR